jgi:hypothetical protein
MPRKEIDYSQTIIYKIVCNDLNITDCYVGHTTSFKDRKRSHKSRCIKNYPFFIYKTINNNLGWDNWSMIEIEKYPCNNSNEARARERFWYEELSAKLNTKCPTLNIEKQYQTSKEYHKEWYKNNQEWIKNYREENRDKINQQKRIYYNKKKLI